MLHQYAVMGNPIEHSKSPIIHAEFAAQTGEGLEYSALLVKLAGFTEAVQTFFSTGGKGLNITVPFKQEAWQLAKIHSEDALLAGAVNTLFVKDGILHGHNTDGIGLVRDITQNHRGIIKGKSVLILGAGGACRGILRPILRENPQHICIANRTVEKALQLAQKFSAYGKVSACGFSELYGQHFDWVINATSASLHGDLPPLPDGILSSEAWCYDLMYAAKETVFCHWARQAGALKSIDGLGMLVEQAAESFYLWRNVRPETSALIANMVKELK